MDRKMLQEAVRALVPGGTHTIEQRERWDRVYDLPDEALRQVLQSISTAKAWYDDDDDAHHDDWLDTVDGIIDDALTHHGTDDAPTPTDEPTPTEEEPMPDTDTTPTAVSPGETPGQFDLTRYIIDTATANRDTILDGIDLGGSKTITHTFQVPDIPPVSIDKAHAKLPLLVKAAGLRRPVMLVGPAGSGKTTAGRQLAEVYNVPFYANSNSPMDTRTLAFGYMDANGEYHPGYLYTAMKNGGVLLDDEVDASNPAVMVSKNSAIENRFAVFPNGERVDAHDDFIYIGSANTYGRGADRQYVGRTQLDAATLNRFVFIEWDYDEDLEMQVSINEDWTRFVQSVRRAVADHQMRYVISPRQSIVGGELLAAGVPEDDVRTMTVFPGWRQEDIDKVMRSL